MGLNPREKFRTAETKCVKCGKDEFKLMRTVENQILAECIRCGHPHLLNAVDKDGSIEGMAIEFWSEEEQAKA